MQTTTPVPIGAEQPAPADLARARSAAYRFLLAALECSDGHNHAWLVGPEFRRGLELLCERFDVPLPEEPFFPADPTDTQSRYLACFEVGLKGPPVPLLASHYNHHEPVTTTIHEHVLFYGRFGARVPVGSPDPPDHVRHELGFLLHLDKLWLTGRVDGPSALRARADFLTRQVDRWVGPAMAAAVGAGLPPVYVGLLTVLNRAVIADLACCRQIITGLDPEVA